MSTEHVLDARLSAAGERWRAANKAIADVDLDYLEIPAEPLDVRVTPSSDGVPRRLRMRIALGAASGIAAAVAATLVAVQLNGSGSHRPQPASGDAGVQIVCQTTQPATTAQLQANAGVIAKRIDKQIPGGGSVHIQDTKSLVITLPKGQKDAGRSLCKQSQLDFRPVVMPPANVSAGGSTRNSDPFAGLRFAIPSSEAAFDRLSGAERAQLTAAVSQVDCASLSGQVRPATSYAVACQSDDNKTAGLAYLLGPTVVPSSEIASAEAQAPNTSEGRVEWTVTVTLKPSGQAAWGKYTGAHNTAGKATTVSVTECGASKTPCADYVAFDLDGLAVSVPVNNDQILGTVTQIVGPFTQHDAELLAGQLSGGSLPVPLRVVSAVDLPVPTTVPSKLVGKWQLVNLVGPNGSTLAGMPLSIDENGKLTGTDGCNQISADVTINGDTVTIGSVATTQKACADPKPGFLAQVNQLDRLLSGTLQWSVQGNELTLSKDGKAVIVYQAAPGPTNDPTVLSGSEWKLVGIAGDSPGGTASSVPPDANIKFDGKGGFTASDGCNSGGGKVTIKAGTLVISKFASTQMACPGAPAQLKLVKNVLDGSVTWSVKDGQLTLTKDGVGSLSYELPSSTPTSPTTGSS